MKTYLVSYIAVLVLICTTLNPLIYASNKLNNDNQELAEISEFCQNNDQASELCYLLATDVLDYQSLGYTLQDLQLNDNVDYAQTTAVLSIPVFLRYLPALAKIAKSNMIFASAIALVSGAVFFKKYQDSLSHSLLINTTDLAGSSPLPSKGLGELKSSKVFQYYSQKGPEHEKYKILPYFEDFTKSEQEQKQFSHTHFLKEFKDFLKTAKQQYQDSPLTKKHPQFGTIIDHLEENFVRYARDELSLVDPSDLSEFEKEIAEKTALAVFHHTKSTAWYSTSSISSLRNLKHLPEHSTWNALLLEHISHLELLQEKKSPIFEQSVYLPFLKAEIVSSNVILADLNRYLIDTSLLPDFARQTPVSLDSFKSYVKSSQSLKLFKYPETLGSPSTSSSVADSHTALLPSKYFSPEYYNDLDIKAFIDYYSARIAMLAGLYQSVQARLDVWNRKGEFKFLPDPAKSDQALEDWLELFSLATKPLLSTFYEKEPSYEAFLTEFKFQSF